MLTPHPTTELSSLAGALLQKAPTAQHVKLVKQSERLVSQTFYGTMLKQMRDSPFKSKLFNGGRGGEMFASMLDQHLAEKMAKGAGKKLVNAMVRSIEAVEKKRRHETDVAPRKESATEALFKRSGYSKPPPVDGRKYVPADYRA